MKATGVPTRARPMAQMAEALPRVVTKSSTRISLPGVGNTPRPCRTRSTLISPTTRTRFTRRSAPAVDGEALDHAADHPVVGRHVGAEPDGQAAEEGQELADQDVEQGCTLVADPLEREVHHQVVAPGQVGGDVLAEDHLPRSELLAVQLPDEVLLVGPRHGVRGKEAYDEGAVVDGAHGTVTEAEVGLGEGLHAAARHLQHLERAL